MKMLAVAAALTAALSTPLPALADAGAGSFGRCGHAPAGSSTTGTYATDAYAAVALYSTTPAGNPVTATVTCEVRVDSAYADSVSATGTGAALVHGQVTFTAPPGAHVELCTVVDYAGGTPTTTYCAQWATTQLPPQEPLELADRLLVTYADPVVCPAFKARAPGVGPVFINEQGDVYLNGSAQWDCPPYDIWGEEDPAPLPHAAAASGGSMHDGRCTFTDHDRTDAVGSATDELLAVAVVAVRDAAGLPAAAEVTCELRINGVLADRGSASGTGVVVVADGFEYAAEADDRLTFCTFVDYADATPTSSECFGPQIVRIPPDYHPDVLGTLSDAVGRFVDPPLCALLRTLPFPPGFPVQVNDQGDVYVLGEPQWDCPPYDVIWP